MSIYQEAKKSEDVIVVMYEKLLNRHPDAKSELKTIIKFSIEFGRYYQMIQMDKFKKGKKENEKC